MIVNPIPVNQIIEYKLSSDQQPLSAIVIDKIMTEVFNYFLKTEGPFKAFNWKSLNTDIVWVWCTDRGTLPKRIAKWYKAMYEKHLDEYVVSNIGNIARAEIPKDQTYYFDITDKLSWGKGDFGDHVSCFFYGDRPGDTVSNMQADGRYRAIRFFKKVPADASLSGLTKHYNDGVYAYIGISRAWLRVDNAVYDSVEYPRYAIFNGYGIDTKDISRIFSEYSGLPVKKMNPGISDISVNDWVYLIARKEILERENDIRLETRNNARVEMLINNAPIINVWHDDDEEDDDDFYDDDD